MFLVYWVTSSILVFAAALIAVIAGESGGVLALGAAPLVALFLYLAAVSQRRY